MFTQHSAIAIKTLAHKLGDILKSDACIFAERTTGLFVQRCNDR